MKPFARIHGRVTQALLNCDGEFPRNATFVFNPVFLLVGARLTED